MIVPLAVLDPAAKEIVPAFALKSANVPEDTAVPSRVSNCTLTACVLSPLRSTVNSANVPPSSATVALPTGTSLSCDSSSTIVAFDCPAVPEIRPLIAFERFRKKRSLPSTVVSPISVTFTCAEGAPAAIVTVPLFTWKSCPAIAEPFAVEKSKVTGSFATRSRLTVKVTSFVPESPSTKLMSATLSVRRSSSVIVPVAVPLRIVAFVAPLRFTVKVWTTSSSESSMICTGSVAEV